jgi:hypothetical protein
VARTKPIPLQVAPAAEVATPERPARRTAPASSELQTLDGLRDIETSESELLASVAPITNRVVAAMLFGPPALFVLTWAGATLAARRKQDAGGRRRQAAWRTAQRRLAAARSTPLRQCASAVEAALGGYLADRLNEPPARFVGRAGVDYLRESGQPADLVEQWAAVVQQCEEASFGGAAAADSDALTARALACLKAVERVKL